ncbi:unnamed protein product [Peronospora destructor]|uniref:RRM domain-containing protein n=1 Tax=Peronospora destructor TaxID=86335 RepID=A0AAV0UP53_9STRA|nr:unnamed protein product [Peronospora destructor]
MAQNLGFARGGTSSWADDDEADLLPLPVAHKIASRETPQSIEEEEIQPQERQHNEPCRSFYHEDKRDDRRESYEDRRGGHEDRRGSHEERRGSREPREERPKNPVPDVGPWKLFVGNLSYRLTEDDLADFIGPDGIRDIRFPRDYENRPKGFAYVELDDKEKLLQALELDGRNLDGRPVKMDVALARERDRKPRDNGRFEKRNDRRSNDRPRESNDAHRERPRLSLLPRTASPEKKDLNAHMPSIFGEARPRDESAYLERKKASEVERKAKMNEAKAKANEAKAKAKAKEAREAKEAKAKAKADSTADAVSTRKSSRDDASRGGRGRGRGGRRSVDGGGGHGAPTKEDASTRKSGPRPKRMEPLKTKILAPAPAPAKIANLFELLNDSDSDLD